MATEVFSLRQAKFINDELEANALLIISTQHMNKIMELYNTDSQDEAIKQILTSTCDSSPKWAKKNKINLNKGPIYTVIDEAKSLSNLLWFDVFQIKNESKPIHKGKILVTDYYDWYNEFQKNRDTNEIWEFDDIDDETYDDLGDSYEGGSSEGYNELKEYYDRPQPKQDHQHIQPVQIQPEIAVQKQTQEQRIEQQHNIVVTHEPIKNHHVQHNVQKHQNIVDNQKPVEQHLAQKPVQQPMQKPIQEKMQHVEQQHNQQVSNNIEPIKNENANSSISSEENVVLNLEDTGDFFENVNYVNDYNRFLDKVFATEGLSKKTGKAKYESYNNDNPHITKYDRVDYYGNSTAFDAPNTSSDIKVENAENLDPNKYIPYPEGPLNRPPVPFDLWKMIREKNRNNTNR